LCVNKRSEKLHCGRIVLSPRNGVVIIAHENTSSMPRVIEVFRAEVTGPVVVVVVVVVVRFTRRNNALNSREVFRYAE
jgi:hypothetical protein